MHPPTKNYISFTKKQKRSSFRGGNKQKKRIFGNTLKNTEHDRDKQALQHQGKRE